MREPKIRCEATSKHEDANIPSDDKPIKTWIASPKQLTRLFGQYSFYFFGPTVEHLKYEFALWFALVMFTIANIFGLYQEESFGWSSWSRLFSPPALGDFIYVGVTSLWLSRHLVVKFWGTWDPTTHRNPTIAFPGGWFSNFLQSHVLEGHIFDRPTVDYIVRNAGQFGFDSLLGSAGVSLAGGGRDRTGNNAFGVFSDGLDPDEDSSFFSLLSWWPKTMPSALLYLGNLVWVRLLIPLLDVLQHPLGFQLWRLSCPPPLDSGSMGSDVAVAQQYTTPHPSVITPISPSATSRRRGRGASGTLDRRPGTSSGRYGSSTFQTDQYNVNRMLQRFVVTPFKSVLRYDLLMWHRYGPSMAALLINLLVSVSTRMS
jgi:hypothetical protein